MVNGKKILLGILGLSLLVGCGSKETKEVEPAKEKKDKETLIYGMEFTNRGV